MSRPRGRYACFGLLVLAAVIAIAWFWNRPPRIPHAKIPESKVQPQLQVSYGGAFLVAPDGSLWAWGHNPHLFRKPVVVPQRVGDDRDWKQAAQGLTVALAVKTNGSLWTWSYAGKATNMSGDVYLPKQVGANKDWAVVRAGAGHAVALKHDGSLWSWGQNNHGQVGDGSRENKKEPTLISRDTDWREITASHFASYALKNNGTVWTWGTSTYSGKVEDKWRPTLIDTGSNCVRIAAGPYHLLALRNNGTLWAMGPNAHIVVPAVITVEPHELVQISTDTNWTTVYSGASGFLARKRDGSWWASGANHAGDLGMRGRWVERPTALRFSFEPWALDTGGGRTLLLTGDGDLWMFGMPFERPRPGLGTTIKKLINASSTKLGMGKILKDTTPHRPDPVKIWTVPPTP